MPGARPSAGPLWEGEGEALLASGTRRARARQLSRLCAPGGEALKSGRGRASLRVRAGLPGEGGGEGVSLCPLGVRAEARRALGPGLPGKQEEGKESGLPRAGMAQRACGGTLGTGGAEQL